MAGYLQIPQIELSNIVARFPTYGTDQVASTLDGVLKMNPNLQVSTFDQILSGLTSDVATRLIQYGGDTCCLRPFTKMNKSYISVPTYDPQARKKVMRDIPTINSATLRKDDWRMIDSAVITAARPRLQFYGDLVAAGLEVKLPNALGKTVWQYERQSNISDATVSMDGLRQGDSDRPLFDMDQMPLPIIHKDFHFSARQILASRSSQMPIDISTASQASQMVAETIEKLALGVAPDYRFGSPLYGVCNHPNRITRTIQNPWNIDGSRNTTWVPRTLQGEILDMRQALLDNRHYGPFTLYHSPDFDILFDDDYNTTTGGLSTTLTLRERLIKTPAIKDIKTCEFLPPGNMFLLEMSPNTINAVSGLDISTVQWQTQGGFEVHFKVLAIMLPRVKPDFYSNTGILHSVLGTPAPLTP